MVDWEAQVAARIYGPVGSIEWRDDLTPQMDLPQHYKALIDDFNIESRRPGSQMPGPDGMLALSEEPIFWSYYLAIFTEHDFGSSLRCFVGNQLLGEDWARGYHGKTREELRKQAAPLYDMQASLTPIALYDAVGELTCEEGFPQIRFRINRRQQEAEELNRELKSFAAGKDLTEEMLNQCCDLIEPQLGSPSKAGFSEHLVLVRDPLLQ